MSNKTTLQNNNTTITNNNLTIDSLIESINNLPEAGGGGITPTGTIIIDENGTYDVTNYASANVDIDVGVFPAGALEITENGPYDVTDFAVVDVNVPTGGGSEALDALVTRTITSYSNDTLNTSLGAYIFHNCTKLTSVNLPNVTSLGTSTFNNCTSLTSIEIPKVTSITTQTFYSCKSLTSLSMPSLKTASAQCIRLCSGLVRVDMGVCTSIAALSFDGCSVLNTVIIRTSKVCTLGNVSAFTGTPIASGTGYVYVPDDLVDSYKAASNWSTYASQIKGLSELPS